MKSQLKIERSLKILGNRTAVVIPVFLNPQKDNTLSTALLRETVIQYLHEIDNPANICLSVDGKNCGAEIAEGIASEYSLSHVIGEQNLGKLSPVRNGASFVNDKLDVDYTAFIDQDGDHTANELINLIRLAEHMKDDTSEENLLILGRRISKHHPLGFFRGELEELADRLLLDAMQFYSAHHNKPLRFQYATVLEEYPDFHSGYKLYYKVALKKSLLTAPRLMECSSDAYYRHSVECVMTLEAILSGAMMGIVNRSTLNQQPVSAFADLKRNRMVADQIIWPCKRLGIPPMYIKQWMANHLPRLLLNTLVPEGKNELIEIQNMVFQAFDIPETETIQRPLFL
ncbi:MAG: hypothetical protein HRT89_07420 [Lentisphaeria bacterium]|nr:hypothetical protein [Lentisphaeria bacterium]